MKKLIITLLLFIFVFNSSMAQWTKTDQASSDFPRCFGKLGSEIFMGAYRGLYKTHDSGKNWVRLNDSLLALADIRALLAKGADLFAATYGHGVLHSADSGLSWNPVNNGLNSVWINCLMVQGTNLLAGTQSGIFISANNGQSWTSANTGFPIPLREVFCLGLINNTLIAGTWGGIYRSVNGGNSWTSSNSGLTNPYINSILVKGNLVFIGAGPFVFASSNEGQSWYSASSGLNSGTNVVTLNQQGNDLLAGTEGDGVFVSTDDGFSWNDFNFTSAGGVNCLYADTAVAIAGTWGNGVFILDGTCCGWNSVNMNSYVFAFAKKDALMFAGTQVDGVYLSVDSGASWNSMNVGITDKRITSLVYADTAIFAGSYGGSVYRSTDNGTSWIVTSSGLSTTTLRELYYDGTKILAGTNSGIYKSTDAGQTWTNFSGTGISSPVYKIVTDGIKIYAGTDNGVYVSGNNGSSWSGLNNGLGNLWIRGLAVYDSVLLAGTLNGGIYKSIDNGNNWFPANIGLGDQNIRGFAQKANVIFVATDGGGVYMSGDTGRSWNPVSGGSMSPYLSAIGMNDNYLFAGLLRNVYRIPTAGLNGCLSISSPGNISGPAAVCNRQAYNYSIAPVIGATNYTWTVPSSARIIDGHGTTSIRVQMSINSGLVSVQASSPCTTSTISSLPIQIISPFCGWGPTLNVYHDSPVFPNPSSGGFTMQMEVEFYSAKLIIIDLTGRVVEEYRLESGNKGFAFGQNLRPGMYLMEIRGADIVQQYRLVKN